MECNCYGETSNSVLRQKFLTMETELVDVAKKMMRTASDPFTGVIKFLSERPEGDALPGSLVNKVLLESFGDIEQIPGLIRVLAGHVREVIRQSNVINIINEHPSSERWGTFIIKQREKINFEVGLEKGKLVLNNISGLIGVEHGMELPLEKILVNPPKLIVTARLGLMRPQRVVDI